MEPLREIYIKLVGYLYIRSSQIYPELIYLVARMLPTVFRFLVDYLN